MQKSAAAPGLCGGLCEVRMHCRHNLNCDSAKRPEQDAERLGGQTSAAVCLSTKVSAKKKDPS